MELAVVSAVAAGNTVILKPEYTPHTNRVVTQIVTMVFSRDEVAVVEGAAETAAQLLALPFDHVFSPVRRPWAGR